jgi:outer membrane protein OmpA-like peptidoglycan-associated protein
MIASRPRTTWLMAGCLALGAADILLLNMSLFPRVLEQRASSLPLPRPQPAPPLQPAPRLAEAPSQAPAVPETHAAPPAEAPPAPRLAEAPAEAAAVPAPAAATSRDGVLARLQMEGPQIVLFETNQARLDQQALATINHLARRLVDVPGTTLVIDGHTDVRGTEQFNLRLSRARARAVMQRLSEEGITRNRLLVRGFGSRRPLSNGRDSDSLQRNRRVEVSVRRGTS